MVTKLTNVELVCQFCLFLNLYRYFIWKLQDLNFNKNIVDEQLTWLDSGAMNTENKVIFGHYIKQKLFWEEAIRYFRTTNYNSHESFIKTHIYNFVSNSVWINFTNSITSHLYLLCISYDSSEEFPFKHIERKYIKGNWEKVCGCVCARVCLCVCVCVCI